MQSHDDRWLSHFKSSGYPEVAPLAVGMEGAVYRLEAGTVAKVWGREASEADLVQLQGFYADLAAQSLPFDTPEIVEVQAVDETLITVERELFGHPLQDHLSDEDASVPGPARVCLGDVLAALSSLPELQTARQLPVLSENQPLRGDLEWSAALSGLLERRVTAFGAVLAAAVVDFEAIYELTLKALGAMPTRDMSVIHGDICGVNILVDDDLVPTAVLDWGFLSTAGDAAFDVSIAAGIVNMYGPHSADIDLDLLAFLAKRLEHPLEELLVYRSAYAIATSNAYDPKGQDGHFAWCVAMLNRADVREALRSRGST